MIKTSGYHNTRLSYNKKRKIVWGALWDLFFRRYIKYQDTVVDLGCGYGEFINSIQSENRIAVDIWPGVKEYLHSNITPIVSDLKNLDFLSDDSVNCFLASNLFEHLPKEHLVILLNEIFEKLKINGYLIVIQPNYRYAYKEYFDDFTHISIYSHISLSDLLASVGFSIEMCKPRFLPLTIKSRFPVSRFLIFIYLMLPFKPFGKQMLIIAKKLDK